MKPDTGSLTRSNAPEGNFNSLEPYSIPYGQSSIRYLRIGSGQRLLLCLHGFGESGQSFARLGPLLDDYTLIAPDLPFHGGTEWNEGLDFQVRTLIEGMDQIPGCQGRHFGLLGYSLGGRLSLSILQEMPERVRFLVLAAPDGIRVNPWYWVATSNQLGNFLFRQSMKHPGPLLKTLQFLGNRGLLNSSILKFVHDHVDDASMRSMVYTVWTSFRKVRPSLNRVRQLVTHHQIPVHLLYGKYDRIISYQNAGKLVETGNPLFETSLLEGGHLLLHPRHLPDMAAVIRGCENKSREVQL